MTKKALFLIILSNYPNGSRAKSRTYCKEHNIFARAEFLVFVFNCGSRLIERKDQDSVPHFGFDGKEDWQAKAYQPILVYLTYFFPLPWSCGPVTSTIAVAVLPESSVHSTWMVYTRPVPTPACSTHNRTTSGSVGDDVKRVRIAKLSPTTLPAVGHHHRTFSIVYAWPIAKENGGTHRAPPFSQTPSAFI